MMFKQCKIVVFNNIIFMKKHRKIFRKNSMEIFRNFQEKYEIFRTNFPSHITIVERIQLSYCISRSFTCNSNEDTTVILLSQTVANAILVKKQRSQNYVTFNLCEDKFVTVSLIVKQIIDNDYWHDTNTSIFPLTKSGSMNYNSKATTTVAI